MRRALWTALLGVAALVPGQGFGADGDPPASVAVAAPPPATPDAPAAADAPDLDRNGREIFAAFLEGRADAGCDSDASSPRWEQHFSRAPLRLANEDEDVLPLFGYVVDQLRAASLPTEFALIPFVESGYHPGARNGSGPAGLWQFVSATARNHKVPMNKQYDGRLSAVDSTAAAVRYLKTLYGMFGGDWRLTIMAYNAGEYRILQAMRRAGMNAQNADPARLPGLSKVSYAYVEKLHALACVLDHAQHQGNVMAGLDRDVPILTEHTLPSGSSLADWANARDLPSGLVGRLNPALTSGRGSAAARQVLAPMVASEPVTGDTAAATPALAADGNAPLPTLTTATAAGTTPRRTHTVRSGESAWSIARRYGITVKSLLSRNGLDRSSVLRPGMVLAFDDAP
jgi:membrane-bound lytic murein transglycosylase D